MLILFHPPPFALALALTQLWQLTKLSYTVPHNFSTHWGERMAGFTQQQYQMMEYLLVLYYETQVQLLSISSVNSNINLGKAELKLCSAKRHVWCWIPQEHYQSSFFDLLVSNELLVSNGKFRDGKLNPHFSYSTEWLELGALNILLKSGLWV